MNKSGLFLAVSALCLPALASAADQRAQSPYLVCGADEADRSFKSSKPISTLQDRAAKKCEPLLEANVANSLAAIVSRPAPSGGDYSQAEQLALKFMLRDKLRTALATIVENRVTYHRAQRAVQRK